MKGRRGLIMGVANDHSIAWGIAQAMHREGAELAFSYIERMADRDRREQGAIPNDQDVGGQIGKSRLAHGEERRRRCRDADGAPVGRGCNGERFAAGPELNERRKRLCSSNSGVCVVGQVDVKAAAPQNQRIGRRGKVRVDDDADPVAGCDIDVGCEERRGQSGFDA